MLLVLSITRLTGDLKLSILLILRDRAQTLNAEKVLISDPIHEHHTTHHAEVITVVTEVVRGRLSRGTSPQETA